MAALVDDGGAELAPVTATSVARVAEAYARCGKGTDPAGLNLSDGFAHALARRTGPPLLDVAQDFAKTNAPAAAWDGWHLVLSRTFQKAVALLAPCNQSVD